MGRPTKYTPATVAKIEEALSMGATRRLACQYAGIDQKTFERWHLSKADFADAIEKAEGAAAVGWLAKIEAAANDGQWTAAAWKLERRYPHEYGRKVTELTGKDGGPATFTLRIDRGDDDGTSVPAPTPLSIAVSGALQSGALRGGRGDDEEW